LGFGAAQPIRLDVATKGNADGLRGSPLVFKRLFNEGKISTHPFVTVKSFEAIILKAVILSGRKYSARGGKFMTRHR
jgi:hypothetical protein